MVVQMALGIDAFSGEDRKHVESVRKAVRLDSAQAKTVMDATARKCAHHPALSFTAAVQYTLSASLGPSRVMCAVGMLLGVRSIDPACLETGVEL